MTIKAIETRYAGCRFRSHLEARWAVFFDHLGIAWEYEPQGYKLSSGWYLPDFLLPTCSTWVEVKGSEEALDVAALTAASQELPRLPHQGEEGPHLLVLGPIPPPLSPDADYGWYSPSDGWRHGFGNYHKNSRPWVLLNDAADSPQRPDGRRPWLTPTVDPYEGGCPQAYTAARSARFEHGERP